MADDRLTITVGDRVVFDDTVTAWECTFYAPSPTGEMPEHSITLTATVKRDN